MVNSCGDLSSRRIELRMSQMYPTSPYIHALSSVMCHVSGMESYHTLSYSHSERVIHTLSTELSSRRGQG